MNRTLSIILAGLTAAACAVPPADPLTPEPTITGFTASQTEVAPGTPVVLSWLVTNAVEVRLEETVSGRSIPLDAAPGNADGGDAGAPVDAGLPNQVTVVVQSTSVYLLTATNARGAQTTASVTVSAGGMPADLFFIAAPGTIHSGQSATLVWNTPGVTDVTLTASPGGAVPIDQSAAGSVQVQPEFPTAYTLAAGATSRSLVLAVLPTVDAFTAEAVNADPDGGVGTDGGTRVHLTWATRGARSVTLLLDGHTVATVTGAGQAASGMYDDTLTVSDPSRVYLYQLAAANDAGVELSTAAFP